MSCSVSMPDFLAVESGTIDEDAIGDVGESRQ